MATFTAMSYADPTTVDRSDGSGKVEGLVLDSPTRRRFAGTDSPHIEMLCKYLDRVAFMAPAVGFHRLTPARIVITCDRLTAWRPDCGGRLEQVLEAYLDVHRSIPAGRGPLLGNLNIETTLGKVHIRKCQL